MKIGEPPGELVETRSGWTSTREKFGEPIGNVRGDGETDGVGEKTGVSLKEKKKAKTVTWMGKMIEQTDKMS